MTPPVSALARLKALRDIMQTSHGHAALGANTAGNDSEAAFGRGMAVAFREIVGQLDALLALPDPAPQAETALLAAAKKTVIAWDADQDMEFDEGMAELRAAIGFKLAAAHPERKAGEA